jgi:hypothetical protein
MKERHRLRVFYNRVLRKIFGSKREEVTGEWRRLHNEELYDLYSSSIQVNRSRTTRGVEHVAHKGRAEIHRGFWLGDLRKKGDRKKIIRKEITQKT